MINRIQNNLFKYLFFKIYFFFKKNSYSHRSYELNFQNIIFSDINYLKKMFINYQKINGNLLIEKNLSFFYFDWLNAAKLLGGVENVIKSKKIILNWDKKKFIKNLVIWDEFFTSKRFVNLIYNYDFYAVSQSSIEEKKFHNLILEHYLIIKIYMKKNKLNKNLDIFKAYLLGSLIYNDNPEKNLDLFQFIIKSQVDRNGFHKSYNALTHVKFLNNLHEIKNMCLFFNKKISSSINFQIINMASTLMTLLHKDNSLPLFNGANNIYLNQVTKLINQTIDIVPKKFGKVSNGISIYEDKNKKIFMDIVLPNNQHINDSLHAGTLAFELSSYNEKIITNCGSLEKKNGKNPDYLRYSAAHSTIILNNTNISELGIKRSYKRVPKKILFEIKDNEEFINWTSSHDGYLENFKKIVKRKLIISKQNNVLFGEDSIISTRLNSNKNIYNIRFHLMPDAECLLTNSKKSVIIKTKNNQTWIFKSNSKISIENSIYVGHGKTVEQNKQIVINGSIHDKKITEKWSLIKA